MSCCARDCGGVFKARHVSVSADILSDSHSKTYVGSFSARCSTRNEALVGCLPGIIGRGCLFVTQNSYHPQRPVAARSRAGRERPVTSTRFWPTSQLLNLECFLSGADWSLRADSSLFFCWGVFRTRFFYFSPRARVDRVLFLFCFFSFLSLPSSSATCTVNRTLPASCRVGVCVCGGGGGWKGWRG